MKSWYYRIIRVVILIFITLQPILFFPTCRSPQLVKPIDRAKEIFGNNFQELPNNSGTYILFIENQGNNTIKTTQSFIVVRASDNKIVYRSKFLPGYVKWHSETRIEIFNEPGIVKENETEQNYIKIIDVGTPEF